MTSKINFFIEHTSHENNQSTVFAQPERPPSRKTNSIELEQLPRGKQLPAASHHPAEPTSIEPTTPPGERTASNSAPTSHTATRTPELPSIQYPYMNRWRLVACCIGFFTQGLNDSAPGALVPYMQEYYHVGYAIVSLIFVANAVGFVAAAPFVHTLQGKFGRAKVLGSCGVMNVLAYVSLICRPPFPVVVLAFLVLGFAFATILALDNVFIVNLVNGTSLLGYGHGFYGIGGLVAPLIATAMISAGTRWSFFYFISLAIQMLGTIMFSWAFRGHETEPATQFLHARDEARLPPENGTRSSSLLRKALKNKTTLLGALLIFAYQGAEVSISGWVISFLIHYRHGDPTHVGYVTSGFWGGITMGRFLLVGPAQSIGERLYLVVLIAVSAGFQLMVWLLPNVIGDAIAVAVIGLLQGPVYPVANGVFSKLLPRELQISSLGFTSSMGSSGGAVFPFFTGALAQRLGTVVLNPICIGLYVVMEIAWMCLPRVQKRTD
ncbi:putative MFS efflux transporter [Rhizodiscina lignyota]|uniref:MFS efflux transporter n=1 Tax=Rhizodiscina lignyota TaxID=1504668 RepID=A0A9P4IQS1_9PEZI|nr:putative MFS efflux transporter [Rhizodiscina lignyota]